MPRGHFLSSCAALLAAALALAPPAAAREGALHALYVGVADYQYGAPEGSALTDLEGAPNDIATIRAALEARAGFDSVTELRDADAGREAILAALDAFASGSKGLPGETLVFYYTGHGARAVDMTGTQVSSFHSTLVPWDARSPELRRAGQSGDILDVELRDRLDAITARGINVVTIFDSCNSGTATRSGGRAKSAPPIELSASVAAAGPVTRGATAAAPGYRVHFAAAVDNSEAFENRDGAGKWHSDFTVALAKAIGDAPANSSYREIFDTAKAALEGLEKGQRPRTEGAVLTPFLSPKLKTDRLFAVDRDPTSGKLALQGGSLALVAPGSRFALYPSVTAANSPDFTPLATASVVDAGIATAALDAALTDARAGLVAREVVVSPAAAPLTLGQETSDALTPLTRAAFEQRPNLKLASDGEYRLTSVTDTGNVEILRRDGSSVARMPAGAALAEALDRIARHDALLAMAGKGEGIDLQPSFSNTLCDGSGQLDFTHEGRVASTAVGKPIRVMVTNPLRDDLYIYFLYLAADYEISLIDPAPFSEPLAWPEGACAPLKITPDKPGRHQVLLIASTVPLPGTSMLTQAGLGSLGAELAQVAPRSRGASRNAAAWAVRSLEVIVD